MESREERSRYRNDRVLERLKPQPVEGGREPQQRPEPDPKLATGAAVPEAPRPIEPEPEPESKPGLTDIPGVGEEVAAALRAAGLDTPEKVRQADDVTLVGIPGIGPRVLVAIREYFEP